MHPDCRLTYPSFTCPKKKVSQHGWVKTLSATTAQARQEFELLELLLTVSVEMLRADCTLDPKHLWDGRERPRGKGCENQGGQKKLRGRVDRVLAWGT